MAEKSKVVLLEKPHSHIQMAKREYLSNAGITSNSDNTLEGMITLQEGISDS